MLFKFNIPARAFATATCTCPYLVLLPTKWKPFNLGCTLSAKGRFHTKASLVDTMSIDADGGTIRFVTGENFYGRSASGESYSLM